MPDDLPANRATHAAEPSAVDPELLDVVEAWETPELNLGNLMQVRALWRDEPLRVERVPGSAKVQISTHWVEGQKAAPKVLLRIYRLPHTSGSLGAIFHMHGGGYVGGESATLEPIHRNLCVQLGCVLVSVDYRLAPETSFPGNIEDCYAGLCWLFAHATELDVDRNRIGLMGESAGGGLAAALALLSRDRGELKLAFQHLIYPMLDDRTCLGDGRDSSKHRLVWSAQNNCFGWTALLGEPPGGKNVSSYAAPARASDLWGLPPAFLSVGALDLFLEEDMTYAQRLIRADVPVELHVYPQAFHGFDFHPTAQIALTARRDSVAALRRFLKSSPAKDARVAGHHLASDRASRA